MKTNAKVKTESHGAKILKFPEKRKKILVVNVRIGKITTEFKDFGN